MLSIRHVAVVAIGIAAGVVSIVGWLWWRDQDGRRQISPVVLDRLAASAPTIEREIDAELARWEATAAGPEDVAGLPTSATLLIFSERGVFRAQGNRLAYYPLVVPPEVLPDERLIRAQEAEYQRRDLPAAIAAYRQAASSTGRTVRAVATAGLGRCLRAQGRITDALDAYAELATMSDAMVEGVPAPFVAHRERHAILSAQGDFVKASHEQERLAAALVARMVMIEKPVFEKFTGVLTSGRYPSEPLARAGAVHEMWPRLRDSGAGRAIARNGDSAYAAVWRRVEAESRAVVAPVEVLMKRAVASAATLNMTLALVDPAGKAIWGPEPRVADFTLHPLDRIGLSLKLRMSLQER